MVKDTKSEDAAKRVAAARALEFVEPGMRLGLGTGSTARHFVDLLGARVRAGLDVVGVPTSEATRRQAVSLGIRVTTLDETPSLDLTIDGADAFDPALRLVKGAGGALLREKIVAASSARMVVVADRTKAVARLGAFPLPIEVDPFGLASTRDRVARVLADRLGPREVVVRHVGAEPYLTDGGHLILDCHCVDIPDAEGLDTALRAIPGVVETGLFLGLATCVVLADAAGASLIGPAPVEP